MAVLLIYPYWNVNTDTELYNLASYLLLIYPYWNVNKYKLSEGITIQSF